MTRAFSQRYNNTPSQDIKHRFYTNLKILNCDSAWSLEQCKDQYLRLTKKFHPDSPTGDAQKFIMIKQAFEEIERHHETYLKPQAT